MKRKIIIFISIVFFCPLPTVAEELWYKVLDGIVQVLANSTETPAHMDKFSSQERKIFMIGSELVHYSLLEPEKIERIGNKNVKYKMTNNEILKIGDDFVTYSPDGKILKVGNKAVFYNGDKIYKIGNDDVYYKEE